ncbi:MAG: NUDIX hydrolase [Kovacikia sp.]
MILQSGVIPYRVKNGNVEILLITSSRGKRWIIPKGWIAPWLTSADSAAKEAWEEAGIKGSVVQPAIGVYKILKWGCVWEVEVFSMAVETEVADYPEAERRNRQWMSVPQARKQIREPDLKLLFEQLSQFEA